MSGGRVIRPGTRPLLKKHTKRRKRPCASAPDNPATITLDILQREVHRRVEWYARVKWSPVTTDVAARPLNVEQYHVQLRATDSAGTPVEVDGVDHDFWAQMIPADEPTPTMERAIFHPLPQPRRNYFQTRIRVMNRVKGRRCWSAWTAWTTPEIGDGSQPPQPLNVRIFEGSTDRLVVDWDPPLEDYPTRGTVSGTSGTATVTGTGTRFLVELDVGTVVKIGGNSYKVKTVASNTSLTLTTNLSTSPSSLPLYEVDEHHDVAEYVVQIAKSPDVATGPTPDQWSDYHMRDVVLGTRKAFKVHRDDKGDTFFARVRSRDLLKNKSRFVPATIAGNDDPDVSGDGVTIGIPGGSIVATFSKPGALEVKHYRMRWQNTTGKTLEFKRARAVVGLKNEPAGTHAANTDGHPVGADIKINLRRWLEDESAHNPVFQAGGGAADDDRLLIDDGTHVDANGPTTFEITELEPMEALSVNVAQVGSTTPGSDLVIQVYMEPVD